MALDQSSDCRLGFLTGEERYEVYRSVCELVKSSLEKYRNNLKIYADNNFK